MRSMTIGAAFVSPPASVIFLEPRTVHGRSLNEVKDVLPDAQKRFCGCSCDSFRNSVGIGSTNTTESQAAELQV